MAMLREGKTSATYIPRTTAWIKAAKVAMKQVKSVGIVIRSLLNATKETV